MLEKSYFEYPTDRKIRYKGQFSGGTDFKEDFLGLKNSCIRIFKNRFTDKEI